MTAVQISSLDCSASGRRLATLLRGHDNLGEAARIAQRSLQGRVGWVGQADAWNHAVCDLFETNLGESTVQSFFRLSARWSLERPVEDLISICHAAREIGRVTGSRAAHSLLAELPKVLPRVATTHEMTVLLTALRELAEFGPESTDLVVGRLDQILTHVDAEDFSAWVSSGLRAAGGRADRRRTFFGLGDALSTRLLYGGRRKSDDFARLERRLAANMLALWNKKAHLRRLPIETMPAIPRRSSLVGGLIRLPETYPGFEGARADTIYLAATAHIGAHLTYSTTRFPVGKLKPLQVALVSLMEDARVEALALREMPGLLRLWLPFHTATPSPQATAASLMTRLARALIDPDYKDSDAWVRKGRALFDDVSNRLNDPTVSREIGGLLGNDIGQMRLQFNAKGYVVEPAYRDDNLALWDFGEQQDSPPDEIQLPVDSVRIERRNDPAGRTSDEATPDQTLRSRTSTTTMLDGLPVATYPEWDYAARVERPDWTTILEVDVATSQQHDGISIDEDATRRVIRVTRDASIGRRQRYKGQYDGDTLDIDAAIALMVERRMGRVVDPKTYLRNVAGPRDLAIVLLLDLSQSTADRDREGRSVLDVEREATAIIASAVDAAQDSIAVHGFNSDGRERVRYLRIKGFDERMDASVRSRLAGLESSHSTRLGAALRHAASYLSHRRAFRKVLLVLTDGEPSDVDVPDNRYLVEDARRAVQQLRRRGIDTFAFGIGKGQLSQLDQVFGERRALRVPRIDVLSQRLMQLYAELKK